MTLEGVDYSDGRPGGAALAKAGKHFAMRYIAHSRSTANLSKAELADLHANGIAVGIVLERGTQRTLQGKAAGIEDGRLAKKAMADLGFPTNRPVYFAVDFNATKAQQPAIDAYLAGAASVIGMARVGVYGSIYVVERCVAARSALWYWQTYAWSNRLVSPHAHLIQYHNGQRVNGAAVDFDQSLRADFGAWGVLPASDTEAPVMTPLPIADERTLEVQVPKGTPYLDLDGTTVLDADGPSVDLDWRPSPFAALPHLHAIFATVGGLRRLVYVKDVPTREPAIPTDSTPFDQADIDAATARGATVGTAAERSRIRALLGI